MNTANKVSSYTRHARLIANAYKAIKATTNIVRQVFVNEREVQLQNKQYEILRFLMEHKNIVWSRDALLNHIWGYDYIGVDRVVDNQIKKLRNALGEEGKRIQTVVGRGYKISDA